MLSFICLLFCGCHILCCSLYLVTCPRRGFSHTEQLCVCHYRDAVVPPLPLRVRFIVGRHSLCLRICFFCSRCHSFLEPMIFPVNKLTDWNHVSIYSTRKQTRFGVRLPLIQQCLTMTVQPRLPVLKLSFVSLLLRRSTTNLSFTQLNKKRQQKKPGPVSNTGTGAGPSVTPTPGSPLIRAISPPILDSSEDAKIDVTEMWVSNMSSHAIFNS